MPFLEKSFELSKATAKQIGKLPVFDRFYWNYDWGDGNAIEQHGNQVETRLSDESTKSNLSARIKKDLEALVCGNCDGLRTVGSGLVFHANKIDMYRQETVSGLFGEKQKDVKFRTVYRVTEASIADEEYIRCESCKTKATRIFSLHFPLAKYADHFDIEMILRDIEEYKMVNFLRENCAYDRIENTLKYRKLHESVLQVLSHPVRSTQRRETFSNIFDALGTLAPQYMKAEELINPTNFTA